MARLTVSQVALLVVVSAALCRADENQNSVDNKQSNSDLCKGDRTRQKTCAECAQALPGLSETVCCITDLVLSQCHALTSRTRRDVNGIEPSSEMNRLVETLSGFRVAARARPFLGKRDSVGVFRKRPRNNFLGKRTSDWDDSEYSDTFRDEEEAQSDKRGARPFLGKKARPFLGKRAGGYDNEALLDDLDTLEEQEKRMRPFLGKRGRRPFLGKRYYDDEDDVTGVIDGLADDVDKRGRRPFLGKRGMRPFLGKRGMRPFLGKRGMRPFLGKREVAEDDVMNAARMLGDQDAVSLTKRSADDVKPAESSQ